MKDSDCNMINVFVPLISLTVMLWVIYYAQSLKLEAIEKGFAEHDAKTGTWQWKEAK